MFRDPKGTFLGNKVMAKAEVDAFLSHHHIAAMAFENVNGYPGLTPVNYGWDGECFFVHCAPRGERFESLQRNPKVTLNIHMDSNDMADEDGMAEHLSVTAYGEICELTGDAALAALDRIALQADKPFKTGAERNRKMLPALKIYAIRPVHLTGRKILWRSQPKPE